MQHWKNCGKRKWGEQYSRKCQDWKTIFLSQVFHTPIPSWLQTRPHCDQLVLKLNTAIYWQRRRLGRIIWEPKQGVSRCEIGFFEIRGIGGGGNLLLVVGSFNHVNHGENLLEEYTWLQQGELIWKKKWLILNLVAHVNFVTKGPLLASEHEPNMWNIVICSE